MSITTDITSAPIDVSTVIDSVADTRCGGIATFIGTVRQEASVGSRSEHDVTALDYDAHPTLAESRLAEIAEAAAVKWGLVHVAAVHRTGRCELGEPTVAIACAAAHRAEALDACRWLIDELKATVPIWKREIYADGTAWVEEPIQERE